MSAESISDAGGSANTSVSEEGVDQERVEAWFAANVPGAEPPLAFDRIAGGHSNLTYGVTGANGRKWALRRPPMGKRLGSAHDMGREARVISALGPTPVPVPPVAGFCDDESVNGAPFYVMEFVDGVVLRSSEIASEHFGEDERREIGFRVVDTLAEIHAVDPDAAGLGDLGKKEDYVARQLHRWQGQWEKSKTRELPLIDDLHRRLTEGMPPQGPATIVHGDYRLDNMILSADGEVAAVVDWELCTLGDPLADVGLLLDYWSVPEDELKALLGAPTTAPGFPGLEEVKARYAERSGRDLSLIDYYVALGYWKLAIILEGVYARYSAGAYGQTGGDFEAFARIVEGLAEQADVAERRLGS